MEEIVGLRQDFLSKMDDDFNTGGAVSDLFDMARALNRLIDANKLEESPGAEAAKRDLLSGMTMLRELAAILGLFTRPVRREGGGSQAAETVEGLMQLVIRLRAEARGKRDFATADAIRDGLQALGLQLLDKKGETTWERVQN